MEEPVVEDENENSKEPQETGEDLFGGRKWECLAVSLSDYEEFLEGLRKSKDSEERILLKRLEKEVLPEILRAEEERQRKIRQKEKELLTQEKMAHAKRSSRIASKQEKDREAAETEAAERRKREELAEARKIMERQQKAEQDRQSRMLTREQRIKEREAKRILAEQQLQELSEAQEKGDVRLSERHVKDKIGKKRKALEELEEEEDWFFDCSGCGVHGENLVSSIYFKDSCISDLRQDDGSHSVSCEKCSVWQHSKCLGISEAAAEKDDFHFICADCKRKEEDAKRPKIPPLKLKGSSSVSPTSNKHKKVRLSSDSIEVQVPKKAITPTVGIPNAYFTNGFSEPTNALQGPTSSSMPTLAPSAQRPTANAQVPKPPLPSPSNQPAFAKSTASTTSSFSQASGATSSASPLPPISNFAPLARTSGTPIMQVPVSKQGPPKIQPALPAYNSPWSQVNGTSTPHVAASARTTQTSIPPSAHSAQQKPHSSPSQASPTSHITNGSIPNGVSHHNSTIKQFSQIPAHTTQPSKPPINGSSPALPASYLAPNSTTMTANKQSFSHNTAVPMSETQRPTPTGTGLLEPSKPQIPSNGSLPSESKSDEHLEPNETIVLSPAPPAPPAPTANDRSKINGIVNPLTPTPPTIPTNDSHASLLVPGQNPQALSAEQNSL